MTRAIAYAVALIASFAVFSASGRPVSFAFTDFGFTATAEATTLMHFNTVFLHLCNKTHCPKIGTGFFYCPDETRPENLFIVSNKHVLNETKFTRFVCTIRETADDHTPLESSKTLTWTVKKKRPVLKHNVEHVDIAAIPFNPRENGGSGWDVDPDNDEYSLFAPYISSSDIRTDDQLRGLVTGAEEVLMYGYPSPLWDNVHNLPIVRKGIAASLPYIDYSPPTRLPKNITIPTVNSCMGALDIAVFPGSSGSPVIVPPRGPPPGFMESFAGVPARSGYEFDGFLLGVVWGTQSRPVKNRPSFLKYAPTDPDDIDEDLHIGFYYKAEQLRQMNWSSVLPLQTSAESLDSAIPGHLTKEAKNA